METSGVHSRQYRRRQPLSDASSRANVEPLSPENPDLDPPMKSSPRSTGSNRLPHHESVAGNGPSLTVRNCVAAPEDKRISAVTATEESESKRTSQASSASTNTSNRTRPRKTHIGPWHLGKTVGQGMCGAVRKTRHSVTGQDAAAKVIAKKTAEANHAESLNNLIISSKRETAKGSKQYLLPFGLEREIVIMKLLHHQNIVKLYDVWENRSEIYLIMEYIDGGELFDYIEEAGCLEEDEAVWIFRQIVAALLHCHRLGITHRDLKPENILVTTNIDPVTGSSNPQIKLVDFGMAALQPLGRNLTTPCGSMHYAAPEVFEKRYDGAKVDVWSLGVIFYVMLCGQVPFQMMENQTTADWYRKIKRAQFYMPPELTMESQDLIRRMLTPNPPRRISLDNMWYHALFRKWNFAWGETEEESAMEAWVGPRPQLRRWTIRDREDINREILRNLRALWHSEKEEVIVQRLLSREANFEKLFYDSLQWHTEEQLENYSGDPEGVACSSSDHHHIKPVLRADELPPVPPTAYTRTKSQFSIMSDAGNRTKSSLQRPAPSEASYDPFRASRDPIVSSKEYFNATVHRGSSQQSRGTAKDGSLRVQTMKQKQRQSTQSSLSSARIRSTTPPRIKTAQSKGSPSHSSIASAGYRSSPPSLTHMKTRLLHRPGVDFSHLRRSSTASALPTLGSRKSTLGTQSSKSGSTPRSQTPLPAPKTPLGSRKERNTSNGMPRPRQRKSHTDTQIVDSEARKVSTELEKACDEAFFRSSVGSSYASTSLSQSQPPFETPPSSVSIRGSRNSSQGGDQKRPLPDAPSETPNTFLSRELEETRRRLAERYAADKSANCAYHEVQAILDSITARDDALTVDQRRTTSLPAAVTPDASRQLPIICEEGRAGEHEQGRRHSGKSGYRRASSQETIQNTTTSKPAQPDPLMSIRVVDPNSSPPRIAPLNIRKASSNSSSHSATSQASTTSADRAYPPDIGSRYYSTGHMQGNRLGRKTSMPHTRPLHTISEDNAAREQQIQYAPHTSPKRRNWFQRKFSSSGGAVGSGEGPPISPTSVTSPSPKSPRRWGSLDRINGGRRSRQGSYDDVTGNSDTPLSSPRTVVPGKRPGFLGFLTKKNQAKPEQSRRLAIGDTDSTQTSDRPSPNATAGFAQRPPARLGQHRAIASASAADESQRNSDYHDLGVQRNWLARIFNIKPATRIICFETGRGRVRGRLFKTLLSWQRYGLKDIEMDRERFPDRDLIFGRLGADNYLGYREVAFVVELFVILDRGKRANLSLARFTQRKGAVSSFRKIVEAVENADVMGGWMVKDGGKRREMEGILRVD